jgi:hypothetical protein
MRDAAGTATVRVTNTVFTPRDMNTTNNPAGVLD